MHEWPSGLRRWIQDPLSIDARVRTPLRVKISVPRSPTVRICPFQGRDPGSIPGEGKCSYSVVVNTLDFESDNPSSNLGKSL